MSQHLMWQAQENGHWVNSVDKITGRPPLKEQKHFLMVIYNNGSLSRLSDSDLAKTQRISIRPHVLQVFICAFHSPALRRCVTVKQL